LIYLIQVITSEYPVEQWPEYGVPAMEAALEKAIAYAEKKSKLKK